MNYRIWVGNLRSDGHGGKVNAPWELGAQSISLDYHGGMNDLHFRWVRFVQLSGLYHGMRFGFAFPC